MIRNHESYPMEMRLADIAGEAFGPLPLQTAEENLVTIARGIAELRKDLAEIRQQHERACQERDEAKIAVERLETTHRAALEDAVRASAEMSGQLDEARSSADDCCRSIEEIIRRANRHADTALHQRWVIEAARKYVRHRYLKTLTDALETFDAWEAANP